MLGKLSFAEAACKHGTVTLQLQGHHKRDDQPQPVGSARFWDLPLMVHLRGVPAHRPALGPQCRRHSSVPALWAELPGWCRGGGRSCANGLLKDLGFWCGTGGRHPVWRGPPSSGCFKTHKPWSHPQRFFLHQSACSPGIRISENMPGDCDKHSVGATLKLSGL